MLIGVRVAALLPALLILGAPACGNDDATRFPSIETTPEPPRATTSLAVHVRGLDGAEISGAIVEVFAGDEQVASGTSDARGHWAARVAPEVPLVVRVHAEGWSRNTRSVVPGEAPAAVRVVLLPVHSAPLLTAAERRFFGTPDGVVVDVHEDATFVDGAGLPWPGPVQADVVLTDTPEELAAAPGALRAQGPAGVLDLLSYGMAEVRFRSASGPLQLVGTATLSFPVPEATPLPEGTVIPAWSFDEGLGLWVEEGQGQVVDGRYTVEVSHFTWWNADVAREESTCLSARVLLPGGAPASAFSAVAWGLDHFGWSEGATDDDGSLCLLALRGGRVHLRIEGFDAATQYRWEGDVQLDDRAAVCEGPEPCLELGDLIVNDTRIDDDGDGLNELQGDCDDLDAAVHPAAPDPFGDAVDGNCDGVDGVDADGDGVAGGGGSDCVDVDASIHPAAAEHCDGVDENCDGAVDAEAVDAPRWYVDSDADGHGDHDLFVRACVPVGVAVAGDCDDGDPLVHPGASEQCGGGDEDCDGAVDEAGAAGELVVHPDVDADGYGDASVSSVLCAAPAGWTLDATDCADADASAHPSAPEVCDGTDDDCDTLIDESGATLESIFYADADGDGFGDDDAPILSCLLPAGASPLPGDCDDSDPALHPGAPEDCADAVDLNCDASVGFADSDGDGTAACLDCDDLDATLGPGQAEFCDAVDSDCDLDLVDFFADLDADALPDCIDEDDDDDGAPDAADCAPLDAAVFPAAPELCDLEDSDCDGNIVDGAADRDGDLRPDCVDDDDDGDLWPDAQDCAPLDATIHPGATESCDGIDEDCDGAADPCSVASAVAWVGGEGEGHFLGTSVAVGDVDGDGQADLITAAPNSGWDGAASGAVSVHPGPLAGLVGIDPAWTIGGGAPSVHLGTSLRVCDFGGDGFDDLVIGAWGASPTAPLAGAAWVFAGPLTGARPLSTADATITGGAAEDWATFALDCGDLDGDGLDDLIVGAPRAESTLPDAGEVYALRGPLTGQRPVTTAWATWTGESPHDYAGAAVAHLPDAGQGSALAIGAWGRDEAGGNAGAAYVVSAMVPGAHGLSSAQARWLGEAGGDRAGSTLASAADIDGDGATDLAIGAWGHDAGGQDAGVVYIVGGAASGTQRLTAAMRRWDGLGSGAQLGSAVALGPDTDGDGVSDLLVGAPGIDGIDLAAGAAFVLPSSSWPQSISEIELGWYGFWPGGLAGSSMAGPADLDGTPGFEVVVGAPSGDLTFANAGVAYVLTVP